MTTEHVPRLENKPLSGIRVIDFGQIFQGPYATFLMAKAGAEVIKVEPLTGEAARQRVKVNKGASLPFEMLNANKKSVTLNLKTDEGRALLKKMVERSDVLLENFAPGVMDRLGVGWEVMRAINPALIYASATGFGLDGPDRDNLAMDLTIQASSGMMACTGFADSPPVKAGPAVVDFMGGIHLYSAVVTALFERTRTGHGRLVEIAMQETVYPTLSSTLGLLYELGEHAAMRTGNRHSGMSLAPYNVYRASDGYVAIICPLESHWQNLLVAMGREDLRGNAFYETHAARVSRIDEVDSIVQDWTSRLTRSEIFSATKALKVPSAPVREVHEVVNDPHMHARGMLEWIDHPRLGRVVMFNSPLHIHGADKVPYEPLGELGAQNDEVYHGWLGISVEELAAYRRDGVI
ncbi:MAG: CoA transferase [Rhizomicrobium sp.]